MHECEAHVVDIFIFLLSFFHINVPRNHTFIGF